MAAAFVKNQAMALLPTLIQTAEPQIEAAVVRAMSGMTPDKKQLFSSNLNKLNTVVQRETTTPSISATPSPTPMGGKKRRGRKTRRVTKHKKRT